MCTYIGGGANFQNARGPPGLPNTPVLITYGYGLVCVCGGGVDPRAAAGRGPPRTCEEETITKPVSRSQYTCITFVTQVSVDYTLSGHISVTIDGPPEKTLRIWDGGPAPVRMAMSSPVDHQ